MTNVKKTDQRRIEVLIKKARFTNNKLAFGIPSEEINRERERGSASS